MSDDPAYELLGTQDSSFVMFEHGAIHMHVAALAIFDVGSLRSEGGGVDGRRIAEYVESRLDRIPHYRQKLAYTPFQRRPVWVDDEHFDLDYHVRHTALHRPGGDDELKALAGRVLSQPLDRNRPLWELWIVEGLEDDRFALISKVHHCMVDGASGVSLMTLLFRDTPDESIEPIEAWFPRPRPSALRLGVDELVGRVAAPLSLLEDIGRALGEPEKALQTIRGRASAVAEALRTGFHMPSETDLNRPIGPHRRVEWRLFELSDFKSLRRRLGGTINDVVLTVVSGAMRRFLERRGEKVDEIDYRVVIPVNMRSESGDPGVANRVSAFFMSLPVGEADPKERFAKVQSETRRLKTSKAAEGIDFFTQLVDRSGSTWLTELGVRFAARMQPYNQIVSNVPGPQYPLYVLGARMREMYPMPPLFDRQGLGTAVMSYDGRICWGLVADRDMVPDLAALARDVEDEVGDLLAVGPPEQADVPKKSRIRPRASGSVASE